MYNYIIKDEEMLLMKNRENHFMNKLTGEVVTIEETDGLYVKLSNTATLRYTEFFDLYKSLD